MRRRTAPGTSLLTSLPSTSPARKAHKASRSRRPHHVKKHPQYAALDSNTPPQTLQFEPRVEPGKRTTWQIRLFCSARVSFPNLHTARNELEQHPSTLVPGHEIVAA